MKNTPLVVLAIVLSATSALALEAHYSKDTPAPAVKAWAAIGDFCGISRWHPVVEKCDLSQKNGATLRTLHLKGGGTLLEQLVEQNDKTMTQTYTIIEGSLPVANYKSTLKVVPKASGAAYDWSGSFDAKDASDADAVKAIGDVYAGGIDSLVEKISK